MAHTTNTSKIWRQKEIHALKITLWSVPKYLCSPFSLIILYLWIPLGSNEVHSIVWKNLLGFCIAKLRDKIEKLFEVFRVTSEWYQRLRRKFVLFLWFPPKNMIIWDINMIKKNFNFIMLFLSSPYVYHEFFSFTGNCKVFILVSNLPVAVK